MLQYCLLLVLQEQVRRLKSPRPRDLAFRSWISSARGEGRHSGFKDVRTRLDKGELRFGVRKVCASRCFHCSFSGCTGPPCMDEGFLRGFHSLGGFGCWNEKRSSGANPNTPWKPSNQPRPFEPPKLNTGFCGKTVKDQTPVLCAVPGTSTRWTINPSRRQHSQDSSSARPARFCRGCVDTSDIHFAQLNRKTDVQVLNPDLSNETLRLSHSSGLRQLRH